MKGRLAVIVTARSTVAAHLLDALEAQTVDPGRVEYIVVGGAAPSWSGRIRLAHRPVRRRDRAAVKNAAWRESAADVVAFLDGDARPEPQWLSAHEETIRSRGFDVSWSLASGDAPGGESDARPGLSRELAPLVAAQPDHPAASLATFEGNWAVSRDRLERTAGFAPLLSDFADWDLGIQLVEKAARFGRAEDASAKRTVDKSEEGSARRAEGARVQPPPRDPDSDLRAMDDFPALFHRHPYGWVASAAAWLFGPTGERPRLATLIPQHGDPAPEPWWTFAEPLPGDLWLRRPELIEVLLERASLPESDRGRMNEWLDAAVSSGLYVRRDGTDTLFERYLTAYWLERHTPLWEGLVTRCYAYARRTARVTQDAEPVAVRLRGTYEVSVSPETLALVGDNATITLPLPVPGPGQSDVRITRYFPDDARERADLRDGVLRRVPLPADGAPVGYAFECLVQEIAAPRPFAVAVDGPLEPYLRVTWPSSSRARVQEILEDVSEEVGTREPVALARALYLWILENTSFLTVPRRVDFIVNTGMGDCFQRAILFVNACRMAGIPAREIRGTHIGTRLDDRRTEHAVRGYSPFVHTWAEFLAPDRGWIPVEFIGAEWGRRTLSPENVPDAAVRQQIAAGTEAFDRYYFGDVDPYRIYASPLAARLVTFPSGSRDLVLQDLQRILFGTRHVLRCTVGDPSEGTSATT